MRRGNRIPEGEPRPARLGHRMSQEESAPRIVVRDRRAFAPDGSRRADAEPRSETPGDAPPPGEAPKPAAEAPAASAPDPESAPGDDVRVKQLVSLLFSQAAILVEQMDAAAKESGSTTGRQRAEALEGIQTTIGVLEVLEEKTRGRLGPGDVQLISKALYHLRIAYMERAKAPGK